MTESMLLVHVFSTLSMVGLIWFVRLDTPRPTGLWNVLAGNVCPRLKHVFTYPR